MVGVGHEQNQAPQLAQSRSARAVSSALGLVLFKIKLASQTRTSSEFRCHCSAFLVVMDQNTRFLFCLHLLTAALGPLVLGKSRGGVQGLLLGLMLRLHGAADAVFAGRSLAVGAVGLGGSPGWDSSFSGR